MLEATLMTYDVKKCRRTQQQRNNMYRILAMIFRMISGLICKMLAVIASSTAIFQTYHVVIIKLSLLEPLRTENYLTYGYRTL